MELFPDGGFLRLQNRADDKKYLHADGDWLGVSLRPLSRVPSLEAVWRVERWVSPAPHQGHVFLLLQNAAYGRYLTLAGEPARRGHVARRVFQRDYDDPSPVDAFLWRWKAQRVVPNQNHVRLRHFSYHLRANGRWDTSVSGDVAGRSPKLTAMMEWTVHAVAATPLPLPLPVTPPEPQVQGNQRGRRWLMTLWQRTGYGPGVYEDVPRELRHVRANDEGNFDEDQWLSFITRDLPVVDLRHHLAQLQDDWNMDVLDFTLCIRPGSHGRLMPLVTHLPRSRDTLSIVVLRNETPAAAALRYPQIYAPAQ